jgi:predicted metal-dependent hydrolase
MTVLNVAGIDIPIKRKNIKNIHLSVNPPFGDVRISAPPSITNDALRVYIVSKLQWIKKQQRKYQEQQRLTERKYIDRESYYLWGKRLLLQVEETKARPLITLKNKNTLLISVKPHTSPEKISFFIAEWYRKVIKQAIPGILSKWEKLINASAGCDITVSSWRVQTMKTKWGSCNADKGTILINLELVKKPEYCLEYVVVHEMTHLLERRHNVHFQQLLDGFLPNWKSIRKELNELPLSFVEWEIPE